MAMMMYAGLSSYMFAGERIVYRMRKAYMKSVLHMDMTWFDTLGAGEITTRLTSDIDRVRDGVGEKLALLIMDTGIVLGVISISFLLSAKASCLRMLVNYNLLHRVNGREFLRPEVSHPRHGGIRRCRQLS
ncbi:tRNA N6-adenosine threonylcarbamoyltransferase [Entomophthora muscae]|uniref:tRNA N6-adenosine threonylcarbamoyltransferase n=1 Tax=Entomophthora muscae TaxID=34485 RepID=A0ACC2S8Q4_9FUNG|nr:tRNA N6-adenosine threonylcarbamoyltransferase [Entomophthora muscae]